MKVLIGCDDIKKNHSHQSISNESIIKGRELALVYCKSCHQFPDPALLDSKTWETGVLPHMGPMLGIFEFNYQRYPFVSDGTQINYYPSKPAISTQQWQDIINYYIATAPDSLPKQEKREEIKTLSTLFTVKTPTIRYNNPATSFVKIQKYKGLDNIFSCDLYKQTFYRYNSKLQLLDTLFSSGAIIDICFNNDTLLTCNIGTFGPTNYQYGDARYITANAAGKMVKAKKALFNNLTRPVELVPADLNNDGKTDYVVCEYGYMAGSLSWLENIGGDRYKYEQIRPVAGAVKVVTDDYNHDGLTDLWALFAQGDEGIFLFTNKGSGKFDQEKVLSFPPSFGSSYFELADFNKDGNPDIIYTCGDNADYSNVLKPYHGVYVYLNSGHNHFEQKYFYPINGCYKALARDFDNDGDLDIATISFFGDYVKQPEEGFIYFENKGKLHFQPCGLHETMQGRWMTMDAGDIDRDGDIDLVLGNFSLGPTMLRSSTDWKHGPPFLLLINSKN